MQLIFVRSTCDNGRTCPNINLTDRGTYLVQDYVVAAHDLDGQSLRPGEAVVQVPSSLLPELVADRSRQSMVHRTARGTILVRGRLVVEADTLQELNPPEGEAVVEIPRTALPELEPAHA